jgi:hypothetical protein
MQMRIEASSRTLRLGPDPITISSRSSLHN